ncbi:MAG: single-stranded DNA-binding protein [Anaerolineae bacterium]|jgi:single-strand DNA-binding protein|nr:single-stranded DNA-binding protein [Anaerolineae bacterium]
MAGYSYTMIIGHVGRDPEMRYTPQGVAVCDFSVAVSRRWTDSAGAQQERTTWFKVSAWRALAETCNEYVRKGMQIMVSGEIDASAYAAKDGKPRASLELTARDVQFLGRRADADEGGAEAGERFPF